MQYGPRVSRGIMKTAVVLFNLGGPNRLDSVGKFLFNLFYDPAIIALPGPLRFLLAKWIAWRRAPITAQMYKRIGNKSPLLELTQLQARALGEELGDSYRVFVCMRYFEPETIQVVAEVKAWAPQQIILLPLYPQFSTTTSGSSYTRWQEESKKQGLDVPTRLVCWLSASRFRFYRAHICRFLLAKAYAQAAETGSPRVIFSAHGLPQEIIDKGDPYQWQVEQTVAGVVDRLAIPGLDYVLSYQSRVGPLPWLKPYTDEVIRETARRRRPVVVVPIAFVSDHSETLVELDMDYRQLALSEGCPAYVRVPALGVSTAFIRMLAQIARLKTMQSVCSFPKTRLCPQDRTLCPCPVATLYLWIKALHVIAVIAWMVGIALPAAAVCVSLRRRSWLRGERNAESHGAPVAANHHKSRHDRDVCAGAVDDLPDGLGRIQSAALAA